ncbi:hypothetical protein VK70_00025 [Paenibacillus durus ATCC 35681]|uniref:Uncharacterized protein n=1 Tax=Paenibacillus durus ATCC 35681 TaxID=1333534 RepID=A0A0F7CG46_PAEDU|nr:hypothetical protein VK70_00025 [Paenibacillus durus ATCC 35681]
MLQHDFSYGPARVLLLRSRVRLSGLYVLHLPNFFVCQQKKCPIINLNIQLQNDKYIHKCM